uniref:Uncharacterized protein n=1 Tax=Cyanothece sp. (strain PCC 7425 / ATCC 29141) TaxID=395961 RepID=B8HVA6_CYAP4
MDEMTYILKSSWLNENRLFKQILQCRSDILIAPLLSFAIALSTSFAIAQIPDPIITDFYAQDVWFGSDIPTVFGNITSLNSDFGRNNKHPLLPLLVFPVVLVFSKFFHLDSLAAVKLLTVIISIAWVLALYTLFRVMHCRPLDAFLFSLLGGVSAAAVFWLVVPESFALGSLTILLGFIFVVLSQYHPFSAFWYVALNVLTVSITITNGMVGFFATIINHRWLKSLQICFISLALATGLWVLQRLVFINSGFPFQLRTFIGEKKFMSAPDSSRILAVISSFFYQTMVMPATQFLNSPLRPDWVKLDVNTLDPGSGGWWGTIAVLSWTGLLVLGFWGFCTTKQHQKLRVVLGVTLGVQLLMHSIYGVEETFIYSLHFIPLLLLLAAFSLFTRFRPLSLGLVLILLVSAGLNNRMQFNSITTALWNYGTPQQQVAAQMKRRPSDPWPRSAGHVVLSLPASSLDDKAFYEPGGSFSPAPGSFGVSIWVMDQQGKIKATSDSISLDQIKQQFNLSSDQKLPGISSQTAYYQASWSAIEPGSWQLDLRAAAKLDTRPLVVIRSVGPAGGAIRSLDWKEQQLVINDRWMVKGIPETARVTLGSETDNRWMQEQPQGSHWADQNGWGYARIAFPQGDHWKLGIKDTQTQLDPGTGFPVIPSSVDLNLPDTQFVDSFKAQIAHLTMGLVGARTHPTDPISYPLPRFRDGAYQMVALARAGQLELAQQLSTYFAETDFLNSTVAEADIPAVGIWALTEVARSLNQPEYDRWLWPHVQRKAELIEQMLSSNRPGYPVLSAAQFPFAENPDFLQVDLTAGKMDNQPGAISLDPSASAISYRALMDAATLADRLNQSNTAQRWRAEAEKVQTAWQQSNITASAVPRNGLWPSWVAAINPEIMSKTLQQSWEASRDSTGAFHTPPPSLHRAIAEAHQRLFLNQTDHVWATLKWFWNHQASPGLFTWGEHLQEVGELPMPESFSNWHHMRGWVNPFHLTPHYWTAAEMMLLQLDMLAYVKPSAHTLVIGAGIPPEWLDQPLQVKGLFAGGQLVNWNWDGRAMKVQIQGQKMDIELGPAFSVHTPIKVERLPEKELVS